MTVARYMQIIDDAKVKWYGDHPWIYQDGTEAISETEHIACHLKANEDVSQKTIEDIVYGKS